MADLDQAEPESGRGEGMDRREDNSPSRHVLSNDHNHFTASPRSIV